MRSRTAARGAPEAHNLVRMRISAKVDYALRACTELAVAPDGPTKGDRIAAAQAIPIKFLENIMADEINHVLYTGDTLSRWVDEDQKHMSGVMSECFSHTNKETWHDMAFMLNYLSENYSTAL